MARTELVEAPSRAPKIIAWILVIVWAALIFALSSIPGSQLAPGHPELLNIVAHFGEYLIFGVLITRALAKHSAKLLIVAIVGALIASLYGASDELHQLLAANGRMADPLDWAVDSAGALVGAIATIWIVSARKVKASRTRDGYTK